MELETRLLVDGKFTGSATGETFDVVSPLDGGRYATVARSGTQDVDAAAAAARRAFDHGPWPKMVPFERGRILRCIANSIRRDLNAIAEVETRSGGKTIANSRNEVEAAARVFDYYAGAMDKFFGETIPMGDGVLDFTVREPVGVVAQITPWNFPFLAAAWKVAPALAAGCAVILKPASYTPLTSLLLGRLAMDAGVPGGVLNVLPGPGAKIGEHMARHPLIDKVAFTGETRTGVSLLKVAADGDQARFARARRQEPEHRLRRCRYSKGRDRRRQGRIWKCRPELFGAHALVRGTDAARCVHRRIHLCDGAIPGGRSDGAGNRDGTARVQQSVAQRQEFGRSGPW